jgi:hypothetical protein
MSLYTFIDMVFTSAYTSGFPLLLTLVHLRELRIFLFFKNALAYCKIGLCVNLPHHSNSVFRGQNKHTCDQNAGLNRTAKSDV